VEAEVIDSEREECKCGAESDRDDGGEKANAGDSRGGDATSFLLARSRDLGCPC
jgi:hypothetical protein